MDSLVEPITPEMIENLVKVEQYHVFPGTTMTVCCLTLFNGHTVIGKSACVNPDDFDIGKGQKYAREKAIQGAWEAEAYVHSTRQMIKHLWVDAAKEGVEIAAREYVEENPAE